MSQVYPVSSAVIAPAMNSHDRADELSLPGLIAALLRGWFFIIGACLIAGSGALLYSRMKLPRVYVSESTIIYERQESTLSGELALISELRGRIDQGIGALLKVVVESRSASEAVAERLKLAERWNVGSLRHAGGMVRRGVTATPGGAGTLRLEVAVTSTPRGFGPIERKDAQAEVAPDIVMALLQYAKEYLQHNRYQTGHRLRLFLDEQLARAELDLNDARDRLVRFEHRTGIMMPAEQYSALHSTLASLDQKIRSLEVELARANTLLELARAGADQSWAPQSEAISKQAVLPSESATSSGLRSQLLERTRALVHARQVERKSEQHPDVLTITADIAELRKQIAAELDVEEDSLMVTSIVTHTELAAYRAERKQVGGRLADAPETTSVHEDLAQQVTLQTQLFAELYKQRQQALIQEERESVVFEILDPPLVPRAPSKPSTMLNTLAGLFFGFFVGALIALYWYALRRSSRPAAAPQD